MPAAVAADSAAIDVPASTNLQFRATITNVATTLAATISGGVIPSWTTGGQKRWPKAVTLAVETGVTDVVRVCFDGQTATTTLGIMVPNEPNFLELPIPRVIQGTGLVDTFSIISSVNGTRVQTCFIP